MFDKLMGLGRAAFVRGSRRSYADAVPLEHPEPDVALVALLRRRPVGASWVELTEQIIDRGDPTVVWAELTGPALLPDPEDENALRAAARDLRRWEQSGLRFVSVPDPSYPVQLRDIHQAPPFLFVAGDLRPQDPAVSVVPTVLCRTASLGSDWCFPSSGPMRHRLDSRSRCATQ